MSVSSNIRKESTESNAAQQMHSPMGLHPELSQLNDKSLDNELPSRLNDEANDTTVAEDVAEVQNTIAETDGPSQADIDENTRASWGQAPIADQTTVRPTHVEDADWNRSTQQ